MGPGRRARRVLGWSLAGLAFVLAIGPFFLPLPVIDGVDARELAGSADRFVTVDGIDLRYREAGVGPARLVLLHGFGANVTSWEPVIDRLGTAAVAFDRVGFGLTERPTDWEGDDPYGGETQVDLTLGIIDRFGLDQVVLVGHSAGAAVALATAFEHPVSGLVLEAPAIDPPGDWLRAIASTPQGRRVVRFLARRADIGDLLASAYHDPSRVTAERVAGYELPLSVDGWDVGLARFTAARQSTGLRDRLGELDVPVLVVTGDDDRWVDSEDTIRLADDIPGARLVVVPDCGHVVHEECPDAFVAAVTGWLAGLDG